jgi:hypothetical protein
MGGGQVPTTRSEVFKKVLKKTDCPYLMDCETRITKSYFIRICSSASYTNCHHFAKRVGELKVPMEWLTKIAVIEHKSHEGGQVRVVEA